MAVAVIVIIIMSTDSKPAVYEIKDKELIITCSTQAHFDDLYSAVG